MTEPTGEGQPNGDPTPPPKKGRIPRPRREGEVGGVPPLERRTPDARYKFDDRTADEIVDTNPPPPTEPEDETK